jgi:hypothetical protein
MPVVGLEFAVDGAPCAKLAKAARRPVEAKRQMIAEVERDRSRAQLDDVFSQHRIGVQRRSSGRQANEGTIMPPDSNSMGT